jgi:hypothetical protein
MVCVFREEVGGDDSAGERATFEVGVGVEEEDFLELDVDESLAGFLTLNFPETWKPTCALSKKLAMYFIAFPRTTATFS